MTTTRQLTCNGPDAWRRLTEDEAETVRRLAAYGPLTISCPDMLASLTAKGWTEEYDGTGAHDLSEACHRRGNLWIFDDSGRLHSFLIA